MSVKSLKKMYHQQLHLLLQLCMNLISINRTFKFLS